MRDAHGPFSTLLLTAPLLIVPTLAAVGLPGGGSDDAAGGLLLGNAAADGPAESFAEVGFDDPSGDLENAFAGAPDLPRGEEAGLGRTDGQPSPAGVRWAGGDEPLFPGVMTAELDRPTADAGVRETSLTETQEGSAGVRAISSQLRAGGADRLDLEPAGDRFYFGCTLAEAAGPGGPVVARRFEAEGETPAAAANDVFAQVRQYRSTTATAATPGDVAFAEPAE